MRIHVLITSVFIEKYETGVAVKVAKKAMESEPKRNPPGTLLADWRCPFFHPNYCVLRGHTSCASEDCCMNGKPKEERDAAMKEIESEAIAIRINYIAKKGKR